MRLEQRRELGQLTLASDKTGELERQVVRLAIHWVEARGAGRKARRRARSRVGCHLEGSAFLPSQPQRRDQQRDGILPRVAARATLQVGNAAPRERGVRGQLLLRQPGGLTSAAQEVPEGCGG